MSERARMTPYYDPATDSYRHGVDTDRQVTAARKILDDAREGLELGYPKERSRTPAMRAVREKEVGAT